MNNYYGSKEFYLNLALDEDEKSKTKLIKDIERIIRTSLEYRNYIKFLKTEALLNYCSVLNKLPKEIANSISLEMHHYPFTLYDLVEIVLDRHLYGGLDYTRISIANEIMDLHYNIQIGLVPLTITAHQLAHSDSIKLPANIIFGDFEKFILEYEVFIDRDKIEKIRNMQKNSVLNKEYFITINKSMFEIDPSLFLTEEEVDLQTKNLDDLFN